MTCSLGPFKRREKTEKSVQKSLCVGLFVAKQRQRADAAAKKSLKSSA
jgi:hypothetical protein